MPKYLSFLFFLLNLFLYKITAYIKDPGPSAKCAVVNFYLLLSINSN
jgi:hypothetical protein